MIVNQILTDTDREQQWRPVQLLKGSWKTMRSTCIIESFHHPFCFVIYLIKAKPFLVLYSIFMHAQRFMTLEGHRINVELNTSTFQTAKDKCFYGSFGNLFREILCSPNRITLVRGINQHLHVTNEKKSLMAGKSQKKKAFKRAPMFVVESPK